MLYIVEHIEARKDNGLSLLEQCLQGGIVLLEVLDNAAEDGTLVDGTCLHLLLAQLRVHIMHLRPDVQEALLELGITLGGEVTEEVLEGLLLLVGQIIQRLQLHQLVDIQEDSLGIGQMLVYIVEVRQDNLAPSPELIECIFLVHPLGEDSLTEDLIQRGDAVDGVGLHVGREAVEEVAHGDVTGCPDGFVAGQRQFLIQEEAGTLAREYHCYVVHIVAKTLQKVFGY